jgi:hypothetical protein
MFFFILDFLFISFIPLPQANLLKIYIQIRFYKLNVFNENFSNK